MKQQTLKDICELIVDCEHKTAPTQQEGYPSIRTPNVGRGRLILDGVNRVSNEVYKEWTQRAIPRAGDIILAREAPLGNAAIITEGQVVCLGQRTVLIRPDSSQVNPGFLVYYLLGEDVQAQFHSRGAGATVPHLNMSDIRGLPVPKLPPRNVQDQIAAILSAYDDLIENNARRIRILEQIARDVYQEWFVHFRFPGHESVEIVDSGTEFGKIPQGWNRGSLRTVCSYINRGISPTYDDTAECIVINQKCIRNSRLDLEKARRNAKSVPVDKYVKRGDILVNSTGEGTLGRVAQVYIEASNCTVDSHVSIVRPADSTYSDYLGLNLIELQEYLATLGEGATNQTELTRTRLGNIEITIPPSNIVEEFSKTVSPLRTMIINLMNRNSVLSRTRNLLLPRLISGDLDVSKLDIEVSEPTAEYGA